MRTRHHLLIRLCTRLSFYTILKVLSCSRNKYKYSMNLLMNISNNYEPYSFLEIRPWSQFMNNVSVKLQKKNNNVTKIRFNYEADDIFFQTATFKTRTMKAEVCSCLALTHVVHVALIPRQNLTNLSLIGTGLPKPCEHIYSLFSFHICATWKFSLLAVDISWEIKPSRAVQKLIYLKGVLL